MKYLAVCGLVLLMAVPALAVPTLELALGVRETNQTGNIGDFMPNAGGQIELFNFRQQTLVLDGTWQQFTFDVSVASVSVPPGSPTITGDGIITADRGLLENIMIYSTGYSLPVKLWIDEVRNIYDPAGPVGVQNKLISTFADDVTNPGNPYPDGKEVMFQEPGFSGSNIGFDGTGPNISGIDNSVGYDDSISLKGEFKFANDSSTNRIRLTTYLAGAIVEQNPLIAEAGGPTAAYTSSTVTFWMMGIPEPATLALLALGGLAVLRRR